MCTSTQRKGLTLRFPLAPTDLMWSDPEDIDTWAVSPRGAGWLFGGRVTAEFNAVNGLELVCRAHQLVQEGLKYHYGDKSLVTVWSAPNYCYRCGNVASILAFDEHMERSVLYFTETAENSTMCAPRSSIPYFRACPRRGGACVVRAACVCSR